MLGGVVENAGHAGNRSRAWPVVHAVGMMRRLGAVVAAGVVLSGCASGTGAEEPTTSPSVTEASGNPWDLPLEQRPPLFDPCAELSVASVEEALGTPVAPEADLENQQPGRLLSCGWSNNEAIFGVLSTWKSREDYLSDSAFVVKDPAAKVSGRVGLRAINEGDSSERSCTQLFFTSRGTLMVSIDLIGGLSEFKGERFVKACDALEEAIQPIMRSVPEGDFR